MFSIGDRIVHPMHGAGTIDRIVSQKIAGIERDYYVLNVPNAKVKLMIPVATSDSVGLRKIVDPQTAEQILVSFRTLEVDHDPNWNKRYRDNMLRLKAGTIDEVAVVVKSLMLRDRQRTLSAGEQKMLNTAKQIFISELALSTGHDYAWISQKINEAIGV